MIERWKAVPGYEGVCEVSDLGRFKRLPRTVTFTGRTKSGAVREITHRHGEVITTGNVSPRGYCRVRMADGLRFVHDLVLTTFDRPRADGDVARHLNGQQRDNRLVNLRWGTQQENADDSARHGTRCCGSAKANAKLSDRMIPAIRIACGKFSQSQVAEAFGVSRGSVLQVIHGRLRRSAGGAEGDRTMKIITYVSSVADEAPEPIRACARIWLGSDGFLPVTFHAADKHAARAKAQAHWDKYMAAELAKVDPAQLEVIKARRAAGRAKAATMRAARVAA